MSASKKLSQSIGVETDAVNFENKRVGDLSVKTFYNFLLKQERRLYRELEALHALDAFIEEGAAMPQLRRSAMSPSALLQLLQVIREHSPQTIIEFGSGASTAYIARYLKKNAPKTIFHSVEHHPRFHKQTREHIKGLGLDENVTSHLVDLVQVAPEHRFYNLSSCKILPKSIDFALIDGPPAGDSELARYGAIIALQDLLKPGALIFLDDYARKSERQITQLWVTAGFVEVVAEFTQLETQAVLLKFLG